MPPALPDLDADPLLRAVSRGWDRLPTTILGLTRERFASTMLWTLAVAFVIAALLGVVAVGYGSDSHAYYLAWQGPMYDALPGDQDAYLYSPAFAQVFWPVTHLPWPVVALGFSVAAALSLSWLLAPVPMRYRVPLLMICLPEVITGNIFWLLALVTVFGFRYPALWVVPFLTKVLPALGPIWFLARGQWRRLAVAAGTTAVVIGISWAVEPSLWRDWIEFLTSSSREEGLSTSQLAPPLWLRVPAALCLTVYAARRDRPLWLPVAMLMATPVVGHGAFALLAAVPRLAGAGARPGRA